MYRTSIKALETWKDKNRINTFYTGILSSRNRSCFIGAALLKFY
ncbi:hypothetical protein [Desulfobacula sp.]